MDELRVKPITGAIGKVIEVINSYDTPQLHRSVSGSGDDLSAIGAEIGAVDPTGMTVKRSDEFMSSPLRRPRLLSFKLS